MPDNNVRLCEERLVLDDDVVTLYETTFPSAERQSVEHLRRQLAAGRLLYHRSSDEQGGLLCFTLVTLADGFCFLSYMATDPVRRSAGIGSKHLARLLEMIKERYPEYIGLAFEIESTNPHSETLTEEDKRNRLRRKQFYERAGARVLCEEGLYVTPHFSDKNKEWEGELMAFEFGDEPICGDRLKHVIFDIYKRCYNLEPSHPMVQKVLAHFSPCTAPCDAECEGDSCRCCSDTEVDDSADKTDQAARDDKNASDCGCWLPAIWRWLLKLLRALLGRRT